MCQRRACRRPCAGEARLGAGLLRFLHRSARQKPYLAERAAGYVRCPMSERGEEMFSMISGPTENRGRTVKFRDGIVVPALGQGSAGLAQGRHPAAAEEEALRRGISLG